MVESIVLMFENIVLVVFFSHLFVATYLCSLNSSNRLSHKLLAAYLMVIAIDLSNIIFNDFYQAYPDLDMLRYNVSLFMGPTLYLYVKTAIYNDFKLKLKHLVHTIPYVIACLVMIPNFFSVDNASKQLWYDNFTNVPELTFIHFMTTIQLGLYLVAIYKHLIRYRKVVVENYSDADRLNKRWLTQLIFLFTVIYFIGLGRMYFRFSTYQNYELERLVQLIMIISGLLSICWILWQALHKPELFNGVSSAIAVTDELPASEDNSSVAKTPTIETEKYDAIVVGIRAYNVVNELKFKQHFLLDYVKNGGNLIIQYNTAGRNGLGLDNLSPYVMELSRDRVTDEFAKVDIIAKDHIPDWLID